MDACDSKPKQTYIYIYKYTLEMCVFLSIFIHFNPTSGTQNEAFKQRIEGGLAGKAARQSLGDRGCQTTHLDTVWSLGETFPVRFPLLSQGSPDFFSIFIH